MESVPYVLKLGPIRLCLNASDLEVSSRTLRFVVLHYNTIRDMSASLRYIHPRYLPQLTHQTSEATRTAVNDSSPVPVLRSIVTSSELRTDTVLDVIWETLVQNPYDEI